MSTRASFTHIIVWATRPVLFLTLAAIAGLGGGACTAGGSRPEGMRSAPPELASVAIAADQIGAVAGSQYKGEGLSVQPTPAGARLRSDFQKLNGDATRGGLWVTSTVPGEDARLRLMATGVGRGDETTRLAGSGKVSRHEGVVAFARRGLTEEYSTSVDGVRQDFILDRRPSGTGMLHVDLALTGATATQAPRGSTLTLDGSGRELAYSRLHVVDANGRTLTASLEVVAADRLAIRVDDAEAVYPIRIDPTFSDANWVAMNPGLPGVNSVVNAIAIDSSGHVYVSGGFFTTAGAVAANRIAKWDGTSWSSLGSGMNDRVVSLAVIGTELYAGGWFTTAGGVSASRIAKWNGSSWSALGSGMNANVLALTSSGGTLYAGGEFTTAGGASANRIAKWNGASWSTLGSGMNDAVNALLVNGTTLYAAGNFLSAGGVPANLVAKWDTNGIAGWSALGAGLRNGSNGFLNKAWSIAISGSDVYVGGDFDTAGGAPASRIAKWNTTTSTWAPLGTGLSNSVFSVAVVGSNVYVAGAFQTAGTASAPFVAQWNGSAWSALGPNGSGTDNTTQVLATNGTDLYLGGAFNKVATISAKNVAKWNGAAWSALGSGIGGQQVNAIALSDGNLYIGGTFLGLAGQPYNQVLKWDGTAWSALGTGVGGNTVTALAVMGTDIYAAGSFSTAGGVSAKFIARWNGSGWSALGSGMDNQVNALAVSGTTLYAGGHFTTAGGISASRVARWNGTAWSALGTGLDNTVRALAFVGTDLYVSGDFSTAGGASAIRIAKWNGTAWSPLGTGLNNSAWALAVSGSDVYAGGTFTTAGGLAANRVAKWSGGAWSALGSGVPNATVIALAAQGTDLYVGGDFSSAGGVASTKTIAKWDGSAWSAMGSGTDGNVRALLFDGPDRLLVGGNFGLAGTTASAFIARADLSANLAPVANAGPDQFVSATSPGGAVVTLTGAGSSDPEGAALIYTWRNQASIVVGTGATVTPTLGVGTHTITLTVSHGTTQATDTVIITVSDVLTITSVTPPVVSATYSFGQVATASFSCTSSAGLLASCAGTVPIGSPIITASAGVHNFAVTTTNTLGGSSTTSWTYNVAQASSTVTVTCPASVTYTGSAQTPCTASASGAGMSPVDVSSSLMYVNNVNVGTVTVSASWAGDVNHIGSAGLGNFAIGTKSVTATLTANSKVYDGTILEPNAGMSCSFPGVLPSDSANVICTASAGTFDSAAVGAPRSVSATVTMTGTSAGNYTLGAAGTAVPSTTVATAATVTTAAVVYGQAGDFTTAVANNSGISASSLESPRGIAPDSNGGIYLADSNNSRVLYFPVGQTTATKVYGQGGNFTTGTVNNGGVSANSLSNTVPRLTLDSAGGLYVADSTNHRVLYFPAGTTTATRVYGQAGLFTINTANNGGISATSLNNPRGITLDAADNLYVSDLGNDRVLFFPAGGTTATRVYGQNGSFTTNLANNTNGVAGIVSATSLDNPNGIRVDTAGNLYLGDSGNFRILVFPAGQTTATEVYGQAGSFATRISNNGGVSATSIGSVTNIALDGGNNLYVADANNNRVLFFPAGSKTATRVYGQAGDFTTNVANNGGVTADSLSAPNSIDLDNASNIYVADATNNRVLRFNASAPAITPATLTITASSSTKDYGTTFDVTPTYTGLVNGETAAALSSLPVCTSAGSGAAATMGTYVTTCSGAASSNYSLSYVAGSLTVVGSVPVTATLTAAGKTYDGSTAEPDASMSCTLSGVLSTDLANVTCTASSGTFDSADAGVRTVSATVTLGGSAASNYTFGTAGSVMPSTSATTTATIAKATAIITVTGYHVTYDGAAHTATGTAIGVLGEDLSALLQLGNTTHTNAGGFVEDDWTFAGNTNYEATGGFVDNIIDKASSTTVVTCPATVTYTGAALESCTAAVTGAGVLDEAVSVTYTNNTNAGTANASATFAGDANHDVSDDSATFAITKATSTTTVTCAAATTVYTGAAQELCAATVTGIGGLSLAPTPVYSDNTSVGTATASYAYAGDTNHHGSDDSATFAITKATSTTTVTCSSASTVYTGAAQELCAATVTGIGGLGLTPTPVYTDNINVGTATASYAYAGDTNHHVSDDSATFAITKATSTTTVTCSAATTVYTGAAQEWCAATVTGIGGLSLTPAPTYTDNTNVGTATASYSYAGDANHDVSDDSATFAITKASSTTTVTCAPATTVYTGAAQELCAATVTGIGGLSLTPAPVYANNTNVGTATASYTYAGDANHAPSTSSTNFAITPASLTVTADNKAKLLGSVDPSLTYQVTGLQPADTTAGVLTGSLGRDAGEAVGTYTIRQGTLAANGNYTVSVVTGTLTIGYNTCLLYDPTKAVKTGATIPIKIKLCSATGANVSNSAVVVTAVSLSLLSTSAGGEVIDAGNANADGNFRFDVSLGPGYIFNLKTTGLGQGTYRLEIRATNDPQSRFLTFQVR